jgi:hypothetical protein
VGEAQVQQSVRPRTLSRIVGEAIRQDVQHFRGECPERFGVAELCDAADDAEPGNGALAEFAEVVENDDRSVGPADQHRLLQQQLP